MDGLVKKGKNVYRIEVRLNPASSSLDAEIVAKLEKTLVAPGHLLKMLMVNHFCSQPGVLGLSVEEQAAFVELSPRFRRKAPTDKVDRKKSAAPPKKQKDAAVQSADDTAVEATPVLAGSNTSGADPDWIPWGPDNPPPCLDTSDFDSFGK